MSNDFVLLSNGKVRLIVLIGLGPEFLGIITACNCFCVEIVWSFAALVDEISGKIKIALVMSDAVRLQERDLDFLMPAITVLLALARSEHRVDVVDVAQHDIEQAPPAGDLEIGYGAFEHVTCAIKLVIVSEVGPALVGFPADVPAVEIAVGQLRLCQKLGN